MTGLRVSDLSARYGRIEVCRGIDFAVDAGELLLLLDPNGAGKSSVLGALAGSVSSSGEVIVGERTLHNRPASQRARLGLSLVPEGRRNIFGPMSVLENLRLGLRLLRADQRSDMLNWLYRLFPVLQERQQQQASLLSGGEQQMLAIAMAVARRPAVLLLDEPSQGLRQWSSTSSSRRSAACASWDSSSCWRSRMFPSPLAWPTVSWCCKAAR
jgi:branched-chain amino acid transport system ATP-binding protein